MDNTFRSTQSGRILSNATQPVGILSLLLAAFFLQMPTLAYGVPEFPRGECKVDRLKIDKIRILRPSEGLDESGKILLNALIDELLPSPVGFAFKAVPGDSIYKVVAEELLDEAAQESGIFPDYVDALANGTGEYFSTLDELRVRVNGKFIWSDRMSLDFDQFNRIVSQPPRDTETSILGEATIQLVEYDSNSENDDMGRLIVEDALSIVGVDGVPGSDAKQPANVGRNILIRSPTESSLYSVDFTITPGSIGGGGIDEMPERVLCGYTECWDAREDRPQNGGVTRGGDPAMSCPAGYRLATNDHNDYRGEDSYPSDNLYKFGNEWTGNDRLLTVCELIPDCGGKFDLLQNPDNLRDGDIIVMRTDLPRERSESDAIVGDERVYFYGSREGGQYLGVSPGIGKELARVHVMDPNRRDAQWRVSHLPSGEVVLQSVSTDKYMTRCFGCSGIGGNSLKVSNTSASGFGGILFSGRGGRYDLSMGRGQWNIGAYGYNPDTDDPDEANGEYVKDLPGYKFLARPIPAEWNPGWTIYVKDQSKPDVIVDCVGCKDDQNYGFEYRSLIVKEGARYVITGDVTVGRKREISNSGVLVIDGNLILDSTAVIKNMGTIEVHGSIVVDGTLTSEVGATLVNSGTIKGAGDLQNNGLLKNYGPITITELVNTGTIQDTSSGSKIEPLVQNSGLIYTREVRFGKGFSNTRYSGGTAVLDARFVNSVTCLGEWKADTSTCELTAAHIPTGATWVVEEGVTLESMETLYLDGTLLSFGQVTGTENIQLCGGKFTNLNDGIDYEDNPLQACVYSAQREECEKFVDGAWKPLSSVCLADGFREVFDQEDEFGEFGAWSLVIPDGVTYQLSRLYPKSGEYRSEHFDITILEGGTLLTQYVGEYFLETGFGGGEDVNLSTGSITNYGTVGWGQTEYCETTGECGENPYIYMYDINLTNFGVIGDAYYGVYNREGRTYNGCGGTINIAPRAADVFFPRQEVPCPDEDFDGDGVVDFADLDPRDPNVGRDSDGDGVADGADAFPNDPSETEDSDEDGVGDNVDFLPLSRVESADTDGDGVGDNNDFAPNDPGESMDTDGDGVGDNSDFAPNDPSESSDTDRDGVGDNADPFPNAVTELRRGEVAMTATPDDSGSTCSLVTNTFYPYAEAAAPNPSKATDAMSTGVNFDLEGCHSSGETVQITIDLGTELPSDAAVYKVVGDSWTEIPGAIIDGSIISYSITDNDGFLDQDPAIGRISDPVSVAVPAAAPVMATTSAKPLAIPSLPFLGLMALSMLIALWGAAGLVRPRR